MTPSSLHAFWSSSCHTLVLQSLPCSSSSASSSQRLTHDLSVPSGGTLVRSAAPLIHRQNLSGFFFLAKRGSSVFSVTVTLLGTGLRRSSVQSNTALLPLHSHRSIGPLHGLYQYLFCTQSTLCHSLSCQHSHKCTHKHTRPGYILIQMGA